MACARWIAVAGGLGYAPIAPGTFGSVLGVLLFVAAARVAGLVGVGPFASVPMAPAPSGASDVATVAVTAGTEGGLVLGSVVAASYLAAVVLILLIGVWSSGVSERVFGRKDDGRIVIDEVVGQLIALMPLLFLGGIGGAPLTGLGTGLGTASGEAQAWQAMIPSSFSFFFWVVTGFVLFRLFDIAKPGAVRWAERRFEGGLGVMMDDVVAGVHAAIVLVALHLGLRMTGLESGDGTGWLGGRL